MAQSVIGDVDTAFWGARAASVAELERELARLRRAQSAHAREQGRTIARASVLNLIVYADRELHARRAAESISQLALRHPSRAIVVLADRRAPEGVDAAIEMHCHLPSSDGARLVSYEQILLRARGDSDERLASAVIPLLVPDLPVFVWWTGNPPTSGRLFARRPAHRRLRRLRAAGSDAAARRGPRGRAAAPWLRRHRPQLDTPDAVARVRHALLRRPGLAAVPERCDRCARRLCGRHGRSRQQSVTGPAVPRVARVPARLAAT